MLRFLLRLLGLCLLAAAFFFFVYDGTKSIANQHLAYIKVAEVWANVDQNSLGRVESWLQQKAMWAWNPYLQIFFDHLPAWALLAIAGMFLIVLGRKKRPLIGYARN